MATFSKSAVFAAMRATGVVPVYYNPDTAAAVAAVESCYRGGVRCFEFTNRGDFAHVVFGELSAWVTKNLPDMILGVGTVMDAPTAVLYMQLGANFVVAPAFNPDVARVCNGRLVPYIPGCATVTEVATAQIAGCDVVKIFPATDPSFVRNILAPMPWSNIMVTGGVEPTPASVGEWRSAGAMCVGVGSKLFVGTLDQISERCRQIITQ